MKSKAQARRVARKEGGRQLENAIIEAMQVPPVSDGLEYHVNGEGFEMHTDSASVALVAARAIREDLGMHTRVSLGSMFIMTGDDYPRRIRRRRRMP